MVLINPPLCLVNFELAENLKNFQFSAVVLEGKKHACLVCMVQF